MVHPACTFKRNTDPNIPAAFHDSFVSFRFLAPADISIMPLLPTVLWAQRKDKAFVTIDVQDVKEQKIDLKDNVLTFSGKAGTDQQDYELSLEFHSDIDQEASKVSVSARHIFCVIMKKEEGHWPRLTKDSGRHLTHIKCDWNLYVDEDEEDEVSHMF
jgi:CS domain